MKVGSFVPRGGVIGGTLPWISYAVSALPILRYETRL